MKPYRPRLPPRRFPGQDIHHHGPTVWIGYMGYSIHEAKEYATKLPESEREDFESLLGKIVAQYREEHALVEQREFTL